MDDASERAIEEDMLDQFNYFDDEDEELIDRREPAPLDSFDLVDEETDEVEDESTESPQSSRLNSLLSRAPMHHGVRAGALHMKTDWHQIVTAGDELAVDAPLTDKSSIVCRTGMLMLASGTGAWRVRDTMNRVASVLGVTIHVDLSLLSFECTCIEDGHCFNEVVSLPTTGVNTHRIWMMEILLCNGLVLLKTYLLTVIMLAHRPRVSMSPYLFHPLAIVAVVTSKPLATTHAELNNNCKLKLQIHPTRLFYKTHCLDDQQSHQALTLNSFPANLRDCLRQLSIMRNQQ